MFYRVDYMLAVLLAGFLVGLLFSKVLGKIAPSSLARNYYVAVAVLVTLRAGVFACAMLMSHQSFWTSSGGIVGDLTTLLFGALFGLAARRRDYREFLTSPMILRALCMMLAFTFALAGTGKAFSMAPMTEFFTQSGYSVAFLKFIVIAEILGGIGLLLPWAIPAALIGLTIDMFGAVLTLNDSTGAIGLLIRLVVVGVLWAMSRRNSASAPAIRNSILSVAAMTLACLLIAFAGSIEMRHVGATGTSHLPN
jgi:uncharacterized membrane protein YphA (DoxX/SURF4 family)